MNRRLLSAICISLACGCASYASAAGAVLEERVTPVADDEVELLATVQDCADCPPMVRIPPLPGSHSPLFAARHELTWKEYLVAVRLADCPLPRAHPHTSFNRENLDKLSDDYPLNYLPPDDFKCYLGWINKVTGKNYRLPSSLEWEHLARAGAKTRYPWGDELGQDNTAVATHYDPKKYPHHPNDPRFQSSRNILILPVESFKPNAWGIYDVIGNVAEYVDETKDGPPNCIAKYSQAKCEFIAYRGGSYNSVSYRIEPGEPTRLVGHDVDHMKRVGWTYKRLGEGGAQPNGYRLVRSGNE